MEFDEPLKENFTIYSKSGCENCRKVKKMLTDNNFLFVELCFLGNHNFYSLFSSCCGNPQIGCNYHLQAFRNYHSIFGQHY